MAKYIYRMTFTETKEIVVEIPEEELGHPVDEETIRDYALSEDENNWDSLKYNIENEEFFNEDKTTFEGFED